MKNRILKAIAIDGPAGAGKSTVAKGLAAQLGFQYIDTGAMYRAVTLKVLKNGISPAAEEAVTALAAEAHIELINENNREKVILDGEDVSLAIRDVAVTKHVSQVCSYAGVRSVLVDKQRQMAAASSVVMDGRDIGTHVLPQALLKIYLTASLTERGKRRYLEWCRQGVDTMTLEEVIADLERRDHVDSTRELNPLRQADDAILVDSHDLTPTEVVNIIVALWKEKSGDVL